MANPLKNKHLITAMLVAPVLALIAYFATDHLVAERPHLAKAGDVYPLAAGSNCRYQSGSCTLKNADVKLQLNAQRLSSTKVSLTLATDLPLQTALVAVDLKGSGDSAPVAMAQTGDLWEVALDVLQPESSRLRFVAVIDNVNYFVETEAVFVDYETSFSRENFTHNNDN
ncbi:hypothetical protein [Teredinibacter turnerae]|uniref:hypothetical protein n=1 Tax=Teredinibacter turnerae TaxID=2426 RepID=UPI0005F79004|nr:hypothetical protein [Teredinibacter turnerae]